MASARFELSLVLALAASALLLAACGGGGGSSSARPIVIPAVAAGAYETSCQSLCTLGAGEKICTATHVEFCVARCRASTQNLPAACADCLIAAGTPIAGHTDSVGDSYCDVGGPADVTACETECDDGGSAPPAPELETQCQLACDFYVQGSPAIACSMAGSADCLTACRAAIVANARICAQCLIAQTIPSQACINNECDCSPSFSSGLSGCANLCDTTLPGV